MFHPSHIQAKGRPLIAWFSGRTYKKFPDHNSKQEPPISLRQIKTLAPFERPLSVAAYVNLDEFEKNESKVSEDIIKKSFLPLGHKTIPESPAKKADKKWEKVEEKTDKLIEKAEKRSAKLYRASLELGSYMDRITLARHASFRLRPSKLDYLYLMGNPLIVLNYVISNLNENGFIDTSTNEIAHDLSLQEQTVKNVVSKNSRERFLKLQIKPRIKKKNSSSKSIYSQPLKK